MRALLVAAVLCGCTGSPARIELEPLPRYITCDDDADGDPANGLQFRVVVVAVGDGSDAYERFAIENFTSDHVVDGAFADAHGEAVIHFSSSHNGVIAHAFDDDAALPQLSSEVRNTSACCGSPCRE